MASSHHETAGSFLPASVQSAAQALRETIGTPLPSFLQALHEFTIASARTQLGEQAFAAAWAEGRTMTPEQALAKAE